MNGVHPNAIITDQCPSINLAIRDVMPNTTHRYCIWYILSKVPEKFKHVHNFDRCSVDFKGLVYDSLTIENFETRWAEFLVKYHLENNVWLTGLYEEMEKWVPVYLHDTFWAISTQRSEGMHAYFDEFVHSRSTLKMFMEQYDMAMGNKIQKEFITDFQSKNKLSNVYTHSIFKLVQEQINRMMYCQVIPSEEVSNETEVVVINVFERSIVNNYFWKECTYTVRWREIGEHISCKCRKFEFRGILCCHIMVVMAQKNIQTVNERYVLRRWRKDVNRQHSNIFFAGGYPHMTEEYKKFQEVEKYFQQCIELAMCSSEKLEFIKEKCNEMKDALVNWVPTTSDNLLQQLEDGLGVLDVYHVQRNVVEVVVDEHVAGVLVEVEFKVEVVGVAATDMVMEWQLKEMKEKEMVHKKMREHSYLT
ncbi:hypothetical protein ACS0TY_027112 [Phlomoides rotata]